VRFIISLIALTAVLSGCVTKTDVHDADPADWGNHKCVAHGINGQTYVGWATGESTARRNAIAICSERTSDCQLDYCSNEPPAH
jgi:hypothetical protein